MPIAVSLVDRYSLELDIPPRLIKLIQVGQEVDWYERSDETMSHTVDIKLFSGAGMTPGNYATVNADFVFIVEDIAPKSKPEAITRALVRLYVTPAAKLEDVRNVQQQLFRGQ